MSKLKEALMERTKKAETGSHKFRAGARRREKYLSGKEKIPAVMHEFKQGTLHSGSGDIVKNRRQAVAIALNSARRLKHGGK